MKISKLSYVALALVILMCAAIYANPARADELQFCSATPITAVTSGNGVTLKSATLIKGGACYVAPPPPVPAGTCPIVANKYRPLSGVMQVNYFGGGYKNVDVSKFDQVYWSAWPGRYGLIADFALPNTKYLAIQFTVSNLPATWYGQYSIGESGYSVPVSTTISKSCGDFRNPATDAASTVPAGCWRNLNRAAGGVIWRASGSCQLAPGTYYLNVITADMSQPAMPSVCTATTCSVPIQNGPGNWP